MTYTGCQCAACITLPDNRTPVQRLVAEVHDKGGFWDAYDQGRLQYLDGRKLPEHVKTGTHMVDSEFRRGFADASKGV